MCSIKGWFIQRRRFGKSFHIELLRYNQGYYNQRKELVRFLNNIKHLPAYAQYLNNIDITPDNIYDMLFRLPIIDKNYVKAHMSDFINTKCTERLFEMRTSGTTGKRLDISLHHQYGKSAMGHLVALQTAFRHYNGYLVWLVRR